MTLPSRAALLLVPLGLLSLLSACAKAPDPLAGRWDVADPESVAKGMVTVGEFAGGRFTLTRRGEVLGIGRVEVVTTGAYEASGDSASMTNAATRVDGSKIADRKVRAEAVRILESTAKRFEGQKQEYTLRVESPDRVVLRRATGDLVLTRAR